MTFLTVWEAIQLPAVALESVATIMPPLKRKARVVVPWASLTGQFGLAWSSVVARRKAEGYEYSQLYGFLGLVNGYEIPVILEAVQI